MAIVSKDSILQSVKAMIGETPNDEALTLLEDVADTFGDLEAKASDTTDWKTKYEDNDKEWRRKYTERFTSGEVKDDDREDETIEEEPPKKTKFEDLFE